MKKKKLAFSPLKGFTLIELLVVIAIIGLLSSIVLASLQTARYKAQITAYKEELRQLVNLLQLEYANTNSYAALTTPGGWAGANAPSSSTLTCDQTYVIGSNPSQYVTQANLICKKILELSKDTYSLYVRATANDYSVEGYMDTPTQLRYCIGSTGTTFDLLYANDTGYTKPGCSASF